ncbi:hypothetical protein L6R50_05765 [Myxococcota bacterium]|nr:hypothetical protein [Myxococcota bacterium]
MRLVRSIASAAVATLLAAAPATGLAAQQSGQQERGDQQRGTKVEFELGPEGIPIYPGANEVNRNQVEDILNARGVQGLSQNEKNVLKNLKNKSGEILGAYMTDAPAKQVGAFYMFALPMEDFQAKKLSILFGEDIYEDEDHVTTLYMTQEGDAYAITFIRLQNQTVVLMWLADQEELEHY